jgi:hypothetical protein
MPRRSQSRRSSTEIPIISTYPRTRNLESTAPHSFANGVILGGSLESKIDVGSGEVTNDTETTLGYKWKANHIFSLRGSAGVGERFQPASAGRNFPYYVLYVGSDIDLSAKWTWNVVTYRFRDAFDTRNDFNTPEVSTRLTFKIDDGRSVFAAYYYGWSEGSPDYQGIGIGFKYSF